MDIKTEKVLDKWQEFTLTNDHGMTVNVLDFGGIITKIMVPDKNGLAENVVLGYRNYEKYEDNPNYFGALIGRVPGRIKDASFTLDGKTYHLEANEGKHHLHGGTKGFHKVLWEAEPFETDDSVGVRLSHTGFDGEGGYPGNVKISVSYALTNDNQLILDYHAITDKTTVFSMTNHSYFNLSGNLKNTIHDHRVMIDSDQFVELDQGLIATGKLLSVESSQFDFREGRLLRDGFNANNTQNRLGGNGYDHYFIFNRKQKKNVIVSEATSGRTLAIETNQPGMVMYTSNALAHGLELNGGISGRYLGVCFETQGSPASLQHEEFPGIILGSDEEYRKQTVFSFGVEQGLP